MRDRLAPRRFRLRSLALCCLLAIAPARGDAAVEIRWWHALSDANRAAVESLARDFNAVQDQYVIVPEYKGTYGATMAAGLAGFMEGRAPHILQVVEVGTATMMSQPGVIKPIHEVMRDARQYFDPRAYLPAITGYYSTATGEMLSFPFNSSSMVMWINRDKLRAAGLGDARLRTWPDVFDAARRLQRANSPTCGFSTAWFTWAMIEQFSAWHDVPIATRKNGLEGFDAELKINSPLHVRHLEALVDLQKTRVFDYSGRNDSGEHRFISGECPIFLSSSGLYGRIRAEAKFVHDALPMPYYPDVENAPQNSLIGGASLWVLRGKTPYEYRGVARFFAFLSETDRQAALHQGLGYLPVTRAAYEKTRASGFYDRTPLLQVPIMELIRKPPTDNSRGLRLGDMVQLRDVWAEQIELALSGRKSASDALDEAVRLGNQILRAFERRAT
ncbi:MAG: sn-glycerol-3-phosphate transporter substrate-binding protein [Hyphomicrobiales bacterium]|nr:sn-glycerol-3-phosphate transporter substrate-binding protein [Hyphomicrobiales bacterium]